MNGRQRKEMKRRARAALKKHYFIYVAICLIAAYLGSEFSSSIGRLGLRPDVFVQEYSVNIGGLAVHQGLSDVIGNALRGDIDSGRELSRKLKAQAIEASRDDHPAFGRSRGVLAGIINDITSGSIFVTMIAAIQSMLGSAGLAMNLFIILSFCLPLMLWFFLSNVYIVISRRMFLEGRCYERLPIRRFLYLFGARRWLKTCRTMAVVSLFEILWALTVVGIFVKYYSYYLVPYLLAENPDLGTLEAIRLSKKLMNGHKWQCFVFELTFLGWDFIGALTMGLVSLFYVNPYKVASFCEFYTDIRSSALSCELCGKQQLGDDYLYEKARPEVIHAAYEDVLKVLEQPVETFEQMKGFRGVLVRWFGILVTWTAREKAYEEGQFKLQKIASLQEAVKGRVYPARLSMVPETLSIRRIEPLRYMRNYSVSSLILMFFIFAVAGWLWEVSLHMINHGVFVNRGVLHGPWLPIYGCGGLLILTLLKRLRHRPVMEFLAIIVLCGVVEYGASWVLELMSGGRRWWDYTGYFLNLNGRICAEGLLIFGIGGMMIVYVLAPAIDSVLRILPRRLVIPLCIVLCCVFMSDLGLSAVNPNTGEGVTAPEQSYQQGG